MNKLKSLFKKDKDTESESTSHSGSHGSTQQSNTPSGSYGSAQQQSTSQSAPYSSGQQSTSQSAAYGSGQQSTSQAAAYGSGQQSTPQSAAYGSVPQQQQQSTQSSAAGQQPTGSAFPPSNAPSTGIEHAKNAQGVVMHTTLGSITIALFSDQTPITCENFATLAARGSYDGVVFHRIIPGFMIQGGDPTGTGRGGSSIYGEKFQDEFVSDLTHTGKGIMSMANAGPHTNGSQFFITLAATPHLNGKHTVFGQVADGMNVVDKLGAVKTNSEDRPLEEVKILRCDVF